MQILTVTSVEGIGFMKILSKTPDHRINSINIYAETSFEEYLNYAQDVIKNNDLQRKRVRSSKTVYSLLKEDLLKGCIMPPIVLAIQSEEELNSLSAEELQEYIVKNKENVIILDGLQRTYTLIDAHKELANNTTDNNKIKEFCNYQLRLEIYVNINRFGVLYRMLTLNTGQTPMSSRHQIEMLYRDMLNTEVDGIKLVTDTEGKAKPEDNQFVFKNAIDGFNAYVSRNEQPMDRQDLLDNIKMMENMSTEDMQDDLFKDFINTYAIFFKKVVDLSETFCVDSDSLLEFEITGSPFGKNVAGIFATSQAMTGFGSAIGIMKDKGLIKGLNEVRILIHEVAEKCDAHEWVMNLLKNMDRIRNDSKKIGNSQRQYFHFFFRELFNREGDSFADLSLAVENGYRKYYSQV